MDHARRRSACIAGGLIEAAPASIIMISVSPRSACIAGGLIEATRPATARRRASGVPPVLQAASLKRLQGAVELVLLEAAFRLYCRRPH